LAGNQSLLLRSGFGVHSRKSCAPTGYLPKPTASVGAQLLGDTDWRAAQVLTVKSIRAEAAFQQEPNPASGLG